MSPRLPFLRSNQSKSSSFDHKLVRSTTGRYFPKLSQIKYLFHFLSRSEKVVFNISLLVCALGALSFFGFFLASHITQSPKEGGEFSEALIGQPKYINPLFSSASDVDQDLTSLVYAGLFRYNKDQKLETEIAESYEISSSSKSYDIKIRNDIEFADGTPLTASDVVYTFELIQNPEVASPLNSAFQSVTVEQLDDYSVRFTLKEPFAPFLSSLTVGILPEHIWGELSPGALRLAKNNLQPIGAGAWQFNKLVKDSTGKIESLTLSRNEHYFKNKPYFKTLRFKFFDEYTAAIEALRSQSVDAISFLPHSPNFKFTNKNISYYSIQLPQYTALFFNQNKEADLKDPGIRTALGRAINKEKLILTSLQGFGEPADSPILPGSLGYDPNAKKIAFNMDEANEYLDKNWTRIQPEEFFKLRQDDQFKKLEAENAAVVSTTPSSTPLSVEEMGKLKEGITDKIKQEMSADQTFYRRNKDNKILEFTITTINTEEYSRTAEEIAKMWAKIGVKTNIEKINASRLVREVIKNRNYGILLYGEVTGGDPDPYPFWHSSQAEFPGLNLALFANRTADKLLEDARGAVSEEKRAEYYGKFQNLLTEEVPAIFLYTPLHTIAINKEIRGVNIKYISTPSDRYNDMANWYVKTKLNWN